MKIKQKILGMTVALLLSGEAMALAAMADAELDEVSGQALFVADRIVGTGAGAGFTFTRVGLDVELGINANINKLQLGCGGFNETIASNACDIDMDYVALLGRNGTGPNDDRPGAVGSDFLLTRPYLEIVTTGSGVTEEVVGIRIGAQKANGFFSLGRVYNNGETNLETGQPCTAGARVNCHVGLNRLSGYINPELSGQFPVDIDLLGAQTACFGRTTINPGCPMTADPVYAPQSGTRMTDLNAPGIPLTLTAGFLSSLGLTHAYSTVVQRLAMMHGFALVDTADFFLSFQRQKVSYPTYDKTGYSVPANAGWWMNVPSLKVTDLNGATVNLDVGGALGALSRPGTVVANTELNQVPAMNCFGSYSFC